MPQDEAQSILTPIQADNSVKADAWQAFKDSANEREFGVRLQGMNLPQNVKADLWEAKRRAGPAIPGAPSGLPPMPGTPIPQGMQQMMNPTQYHVGSQQLPPGTRLNPRTGLPMVPPPGDTGQGTLNVFPAVGGAVGGAFGGVPGAALGGIAGEGLKQLAAPLAGGTAPANPPAEMLKQGAIMGTLEGAGKYVAAPLIKYGVSKLASFSGRPAAEIAELTQLPQREEEIRQRITQGYRAAKASASAAYPQIKTAVDIAPAQNVAQQISGQMLAHNAPQIVGRMADMSGAQQLQVASITPDLDLVLRKIATTNSVPFNDAQQLYSALGESLAKGRGQLPGETYNALKAVRDTLGDQMKAAAQADGKLAEFTKAQKGWQKLMDDWVNPGAPMKQVTSAASKKQFAVMKKFVGDDGARIVKTMDKYGIETRDIQALQQLGREQAQGKISDAAELARMGTQAFQQQSGQAAKMEALKKGAALAGGGGLLYDLLRHVGPTPGTR